MTRLGYHLRQALGCLRHAPYATVIAILTMGAALAFSGTALLGARAVEAGLRSLATEARFTIFLTEEASATSIGEGTEGASGEEGTSVEIARTGTSFGAAADDGIDSDRVGEVASASGTDLGVEVEPEIESELDSDLEPAPEPDRGTDLATTLDSAASSRPVDAGAVASSNANDVAFLPAIHPFAKLAAETAGSDASAEFLTPDEALNRLRDELGPMGSALDSLVDNPLPASVEVRLAKAPGRTLDDVHDIARRLSALPFASEVDYGASFIDRIESLLTFIRTAGLVLFLVVLGVTLFLVGNVVRLTVYARRDEIEILRLVGATDTFVATPFLLEGALQGLAGGILAVVGLLLARSSLFPLLTDGLGFGSQFQPPAPEPLLLFGLVAVGITVGTVASAFGVFRFLRSVR